jgi:hypothetical protein
VISARNVRANGLVKMSNLIPPNLPFRTYLRRRSKRHMPESMFVNALVHDDDFAALGSREELNAYLALHKVGPDGRLLAHTVWNSYLVAKNVRVARLNAASVRAVSNSKA